MKNFVLAACAALSLGVSSANAQSIKQLITEFPGGRQISIVTSVDHGAFAPRQNVINTILCLDGQPCMSLGLSTARGASVAGSFLAPVVEAGGFVAGMAMIRPPKIDDHSQTNVSSGSNSQGGEGLGFGGYSNAQQDSGNTTQLNSNNTLQNNSNNTANSFNTTGSNNPVNSNNTEDSFNSLNSNNGNAYSYNPSTTCVASGTFSPTNNCQN